MSVPDATVPAPGVQLTPSIGTNVPVVAAPMGSSPPAAVVQQISGSGVEQNFASSTVHHSNGIVQTTGSTQPVGAAQQLVPATGNQVYTAPQYMNSALTGQVGCNGQLANMGHAACAGHTAGYAGQMNGYMAQPGYPGHPGQPGQPDFPGQQGMPQDMVPQLNFRTIIRFVMELAAMIQGCALIAMMASGLSQQVSSEEEQPLRKFGLWVKGAITGLVSRSLPFWGAHRRRKALEGAWAIQTSSPPQPARWWVWIGTSYFVATLLQELMTYRRIMRSPVAPPSAPLASAPGPCSSVQQGAYSALPPPVGQTLPKTQAEGDAAGGKVTTSNPNSNMVEFYMQKQREMHLQRTGQLPASNTCATVPVTSGLAAHSALTS